MPLTQIVRSPLHLCLRYGRRQFHASAPRGTFLDTTTTLLTTLHTTTGLTWGLLIPFTALSLRAFLTTPLTLYSRNKTATILRLTPVHGARTRQRATQFAPFPPDDWETVLRAQAKKDQKLLWNRWNCQRWKLYLPFLQLPVWVVASASLRALLPPRGTDTDTGTGTGTGTDWLLDAFGGMTSAVGDVGLAVEGPWWALDLTAPDPSGVLPVAFAAVVWANTALHAWERPPMGKWGRRLMRGLLVLPVGMAWVAHTTPAALVLYWAASAGWSLALGAWMWAQRPLPEKM